MVQEVYGNHLTVFFSRPALKIDFPNRSIFFPEKAIALSGEFAAPASDALSTFFLVPGPNYPRTRTEIYLPPFLDR
ncbi:hypothetical protein V0288_13865 [Pannus brasiliensis CCIBt3594]|uniref:Uncharacterized protein n=1 Tax=Pannus brasiliensis CCIBt3594 TaxID=1427578 RepID=A0AAW9QW22_9CHRO